MDKNTKIEISYKTIIFAVLFVVSLQFVWILKDLFFSFLIGFILMSALRPRVESLKRHRVPHALAVVSVYLTFLLFFIALFVIVIPPIVNETFIFLKNLPSIVEAVSDRLSPWVPASTLTNYIPNVTDQVFKVLTGVLSNALFIVSTLFFGFYFLLDSDALERMVTRYLSEHHAKRVVRVLKYAEERMSSWFWGELTLMTIVGLLSFIGFSIAGIRYALPLAVLAGILEVVPTMGPLIATIPAFLVGISTSNIQGASAIAVSLVVQQLENNLIVPVVMKRAVGISPVVTLVCLIVGGKIGGVLGVLLAIPLFLFMESILLEFRKEKVVAEKPR